MTDPYAAPAGPGEPTDPWSSGPGLGSDPAPDASPETPSTPAGYPPADHAASGPSALPQAGDVAALPQQSAPAWPTQATAHYPQPAPPVSYPQPAPQAGYQQPPYATYPEPYGPANQLGATGYSPYAPSAYAGQNLPAISDPVAYDYGYSRPPQGGETHPQAATSMVLGILGLVAFSPLAPVAWYLAAKARREMAAQPGRWQASGMVTAGYVLGIIGTALLGLFVVFVVLAFVLAAAASF